MVWFRFSSVFLILDVVMGIVPSHLMLDSTLASTLKPAKCENQDLIKILNILLEFLNGHTTDLDKTKYILNLMKKYLDESPQSAEKNEAIKNIVTFEQNLNNQSIPKGTLRNTANSVSPKPILKTQIVFKQQIPNINEPNCKDALKSLIQKAYNTYLQLTKFPTCQLDGFYPDVKGPNIGQYVPKNQNPQDLSFDLTVVTPNEFQLPRVPNKKNMILFSNLNPNRPSNYLFNYLQNQISNPNILSLLQNYRAGENIPNENNQVPFSLEQPQSPIMNPVEPFSTFTNLSNPKNILLNIDQNQANKPGIVYHSGDQVAPATISPTESPFFYPDNTFNVPGNDENQSEQFPDGNINLPKNHWKPPLNVIIEDINKQTSKNLSLDDILKILGADIDKSGFNEPNYIDPSSLPSLIDKLLTPNTPKLPTDVPLQYVIPGQNENTIHTNPYQSKNNGLNVKNQEPNTLKQILWLYNKYLPNHLNSQNLNSFDENKLQNLLHMYPKNIYNPNSLLNPNNLSNIYQPDLNRPSIDVAAPGHNNINQNFINPGDLFNQNQGNTNQNASPPQKGDKTLNVDKQPNLNLNQLNYLLDYLKQQNMNQQNRLPNSIGSNLFEHGFAGNNLMLSDLQRLMSVANLLKLNSLPTSKGVIELTYVLKRPKPLIFHPYYYVKYRLPYLTFLNNLFHLLLKNPVLRSNPEQLYQELITLSNITDVSPDLKGIQKDDILKLVIKNGALVDAKVVNGHDPFLNEQLKIIRNINAELKPEEIMAIHKNRLNVSEIKNELNVNTTETVTSKQMEATTQPNLNPFYPLINYRPIPNLYQPVRLNNNPSLSFKPYIPFYQRQPNLLPNIVRQRALFG